MNKKIIVLIILANLAIGALVGCNSVAKKMGGTINVDLPKGQKLVNVTWKDANLWYLTKQMKDGDIAETYEFKEDSNFGIVEGKVIFKESK
ncbi:MAG: hypothetical protein K0R18_166 [Bacillales bacterium]|jgi:hypothetical protein|nr:hypothetical protein [Bacillales bacterium]